MHFVGGLSLRSMIFSGTGLLLKVMVYFGHLCFECCTFPGSFSIVSHLVRVLCDGKRD